MNPYSSLPDHCFWRKAVSRVARNEFDPVVRPKFHLSTEDRIATAGSCFAQHISRRLRQCGFRYFVTEPGPGLSNAERRRRGFGDFSARFGNIYTPRQLLQLVEEAFGRRTPEERVWRRPDGRFVDALRPRIEPDGFDAVDAVLSSRVDHLSSVRRLIENMDVFLFTLGLTETWALKSDGTVYPVAPGVVAGQYDATRYQFLNIDAQSTVADLANLFSELKALNPPLKAVLTVSPVPLVATYEDRNVLVSSVYSKSVLRVAAEEIQRRFDWIDYFPSYEIITGSYNFGQYFEEDAREVNPQGVSHAMRVFLRHYAGGRRLDEESPRAERGDSRRQEAKLANEIVCDEEAVAAIRI